MGRDTKYAYVGLARGVNRTLAEASWNKPSPDHPGNTRLSKVSWELLSAEDTALSPAQTSLDCVTLGLRREMGRP